MKATKNGVESAVKKLIEARRGQDKPGNMAFDGAI